MKRFVSIFLLFTLCLINLTVFSDENSHQKQTLKVGFYQIDFYQELNDSGDPSGYVYDYLSKVGQYAGWDFEYIKAPFADCLNMLENGQVDIVCGISKNREDAYKYDFSKYEMSTAAYELYASSAREDMNFDNLGKTADLKIGILEGSRHNYQLDDYINKYGYTYQPIYFKTQFEMQNALFSNQIDLIYTIGSGSKKNLKVITRFPEMPVYFALTKGSPYLNKLDNILFEMKNISPAFSYQMHKKYFNNGQIFQPNFTQQEIDFINSSPEFKVVYDPYWAPIEYYDTNNKKYSGISADVLQLISKYSGLKFTIIDAPSYEEACRMINEGEADIISGITYDYNWASEHNVSLSNPYLNSNIIQIKKIEESNKNTIALPKGFYINKFIREKYESTSAIIEYDTIEECFDAVENGNVNCTYANSITANYLLSKFKYSDLVSNDLTGSIQDISIGVSDTADPTLLRIIDKSLLSITNGQIDNIIVKNNNIYDDSYNLKTLFHSYPDMMTLLLSIIILFLIIFFICFFIIVKNKIKAKRTANDVILGKVLMSMYDQVWRGTYNNTSSNVEVINRNGVSNSCNFEFGLKKYIEYICLNNIHPNDRKNFLEYFSDVNMSKLFCGESFSFEARTCKQDGKYSWYMYFVESIHDDNKTKSGCKCILIANRNIDETKKRQIEYENGLRDALIVAENSAKTRDKFLRNISHEIRTPLNAIIGFTNLSKQNIDDKVKLNNYLQKTEYASKHLLSLINDILDLSKIDSGKLQTKTEKFVLKDAVDELLAAINAQTEEKNIDLKISFDKRLSGLALIGDSLRFKQIMLNILSNAVKFTGKNGKIEFDILRRSEVDNILYISFIITDNGIGMTDEFKDRIFTPFEQQDERISREYGGTGLGMSIVKNLVTLLKGSINIKSKSGSGTSVTVELPFKYENNQTKLSKNDHSENSEKSIAGKNILVTEDNALNREIISELLKSQNANVELAVDGLDAVKKYNNSADNYFDLILMDVQMPNLDGYEATAQIRNSEKPDAVTIPIIAITAHSFESDITKALSSGMNAHISKPINVDDMFKTLHKYI